MPELLRQPVVVAQFARQLLQHWDRNSQRPVSGHRKPCHRFPNFWVGEMQDVFIAAILCFLGLVAIGVGAVFAFTQKVYVDKGHGVRVPFTELALTDGSALRLYDTSGPGSEPTVGLPPQIGEPPSGRRDQPQARAIGHSGLRPNGTQ